MSNGKFNEVPGGYSPADKIDDLMNIGAACDWITPTIYIMQDFFKGPVSRFGILANAGFDRGGVKRVLSKYGVESWGYIYNVAGDMFMLSVPQKQGNWAYYLLQREGIPILGTSVEAVGTEASRPTANLDNTAAFPGLTLVKSEPGPVRLVRWLVRWL